MRRLQTMLNVGLLIAIVLAEVTQAQVTEKPNLNKQPTLYIIGYAHLDTEWR